MTEDNPPTAPQSSSAVPPATAAPKRKRRQLSAEELSDRRIKRWAELLETIVLTVATLAAVWAGYQAGQWGGRQTTLNIDATTRRIEATQSSGRAQQLQLVDIGLFTNWVNAFAMGDEARAGFYQDRFRDEFQPAFDAWLATQPLQNPDAPGSPFEMPEYQVAGFAQADQLEAEAGRMTQEAEEAGAIGDRFTLTAVILASSLLLAGLSSRFEWEELRGVVVVAALLVLLFCVVSILRLPVA